MLLTDARNEFLTLARALNQRHQIEPILYGSVGLGNALGTDFDADDIDVLVPAKLLGDDWRALIATMAELGYALRDLPEHEFRKQGMSVAFAAEETLISFAGVQPSELIRRTGDDVSFRELSLSNYLSVYKKSALDDYRRNKAQTDLLKVELIESQIRSANPSRDADAKK